MAAPAGKIVSVVTGANGGIGLAICRGLARTNNHIVIAAARSPEKAEGVVHQLQQEGLSDVIPYGHLDVTDPDAAAAMAEHVKSHVGHVGVLINNAGLLNNHKSSALATTPEQMQEHLDVNFLGPMRVAQAFWPHFRALKYGRVVNVGAGMGQLSKPGSNGFGYRASKTALSSLTVSLAALRTRGVIVNQANPGFTDTQMSAVFGKGPNTPDQGADTILWLATLPDGSPSGKFYENRQEIPW